MFFSKSKDLQDYSFHIGDARVEVVTRGVVLSANGSLKQAVSTLADQAKKSLFFVECKSHFLHFPPLLIMCHFLTPLFYQSWSMFVNCGDFIRLMNLSSYTGNFASLYYMCLLQSPH